MKWRLALMLFLLAVMAGGFGYWRWYEWRDHSQDAPILAAAHRYGVAPALVKAVVWRESRFNPTRRGRAGEFGLMQIREAAGFEWAEAEHITSFVPEHLLDPTTNTLAGSWYLRKLIKRYSPVDRPLPYVLADYNAGRSNVLKWEQGLAATNSAAFLAQMTFPGTRAYIHSITRRFNHYLPIFPPKEAQK